MRLHRYFARKFLLTFLNVLAIFAVILAVIDIIEEVRRFSGNGVGFPEMMWLTLLNVPETLYEFLPLVMILSSLALSPGPSAIIGVGGHARLGLVSNAGARCTCCCCSVDRCNRSDGFQPDRNWRFETV